VHRDQIQFPPKHLALREDVHQLGVLVGEMLREQGGDSLYDLVEGDRKAAIAQRTDPAADVDGLSVRVIGRPPAEARDLVRAFSAWFQAVNLAEKVHRIRRRRQYFLADGGKPQPGGIEDALAQLKAQGLSLADTLKLLGSLRIRPILTAHPTESTRRTQLRRQQRMAAALLDRLNPNLEPQERRNVWARLRTEVTTGWQTEEHSRQRLTVADEREFALFHFAEVLYRIVPTFYEEIAAALEALYGASLADVEPVAVLQFGSWVGGDMEGAPDINAKTLRETLVRQQQVILNEYFSECQTLSQLLSQSANRVSILPELGRRIDEYNMLLPGTRTIAPARHDQMPYRVFFAQMGQRLRHTYDGRAGRYERAEQFRADLALVAQSLKAHLGTHAGYQLVRRLILRVDTFGFHLATIDLKQRADVHHAVVGQGFDDPAWLQRAPQDRMQRLEVALERNSGPAAPLDALGRRTLAVFEAAQQCRARYGERAIGDYIVAGTAGPDDLLAPLVLSRWAGVDDRRSGEVGLDFAPLFESADSLRNSGNIMRELMTSGSYRTHLAARGEPQPLYVGYSQAGRDEGFLSMRLAVFDAQRDLAQTLAQAGQPAAIYHARGASTARGGSRLDAIIRSAPPETIDGVLRITEQGEIISQNYGLHSIALRTLERAFGQLGLATLAQRRGSFVVETTAQHALLQGLAENSRQAWRALVVEDSAFHDFFRSVTPIDVIERMQVGSRSIWDAGVPGAGVLAVRPTPWVFAWTQTRYFLPGWYGAGTALQRAISAGNLAALQEAWGDWRLFTSIVDDIEMQLARIDLGIGGHYVGLVSPGLERFAPMIAAEFERCRDAVLAIKQASELLDGDRTQQRAIQLRNPYIDPMNLMQVDLLRRWRATAREDDDLFQALLASVSGIAQGLQTTG
jgi:phosphoenolpyruvate carboxylase